MLSDTDTPTTPDHSNTSHPIHHQHQHQHQHHPAHDSPRRFGEYYSYYDLPQPKEFNHAQSPQNFAFSFDPAYHANTETINYMNPEWYNHHYHPQQQQQQQPSTPTFQPRIHEDPEKIKKQKQLCSFIEFLFSDDYLVSDEMMLNKVLSTNQVPIIWLYRAYQGVYSIADTPDAIMVALQHSTKLNVSNDYLFVARKDPLPPYIISRYMPLVPNPNFIHYPEFYPQQVLQTEGSMGDSQMNSSDAIDVSYGSSENLNNPKPTDNRRNRRKHNNTHPKKQQAPTSQEDQPSPLTNTLPQPISPTETFTGTIAHIRSTYGFIHLDKPLPNNTIRVFFPFSYVIPKTATSYLSPGTKVTFNLEFDDTRQTYRAGNVFVIPNNPMPQVNGKHNGPIAKAFMMGLEAMQNAQMARRMNTGASDTHVYTHN